LVDWSAYRIIEEAITNVAKHAPAARTEVTIRFSQDDLFLSIVNDGKGNRHEANGTNGNGRGLVGMRERAAVLGGQIYIGPDGGSGFAVRARLPGGVRS
jgi:signal transduction histidine kinase